ncbi:hypothetical protein L5515_013999 [Caenorhabditis briggsae]|nr:hypothetical protein L5515_013999 [Caenorhabditis briggsae]
MLTRKLEEYRQRIASVFLYDWICIPLVYCQVSTISVYGYFLFALIGRQYPSKNENEEIVDVYVPIFTILQFLFYVGWLKVGEDLMFPFGADDEDFEFNYILERNLEVSMLIVDDLHNQVPPVYVESLDDEIHLLHTSASSKLSNHPQRQHLRKLKFNVDAMQVQAVPGNHLNERDVSVSTTSKLSFADLENLANGPKNLPKF